MAHDEFLSCADDHINQPGAAPSSVRSSLRHSGSGHSFASARSSGVPDQFHSVASTLHSGTLVGSNNMLQDDQENTLAESIIDSMHRYFYNFKIVIRYRLNSQKVDRIVF